MSEFIEGLYWSNWRESVGDCRGTEEYAVTGQHLYIYIFFLFSNSNFRPEERYSKKSYSDFALDPPAVGKNVCYDSQ